MPPPVALGWIVIGLRSGQAEAASREARLKIGLQSRGSDRIGAGLLREPTTFEVSRFDFAHRPSAVRFVCFPLGLHGRFVVRTLPRELGNMRSERRRMTATCR